MRAAALVLTLAASAHTLGHGLTQPGHALAFGLLVAFGELARRGGAPGEREPAPLAAAGALAYALLGDSELLVAFGELARRGGAPGEREPAPLAAAGALAYA
ncbi:metal-dependent phosphohydrolase, partial [Streptomyces microflavus]